MSRASWRRFVQGGLAAAGVGVLAVGGTIAYRAFRPPRVPHIGFLALPSSSSQALQAQIEAFRQGLRELGYVEGQTITIEWRYADNSFDQFRVLAAELVSLPVDLIVVTGGADPVVKEAITTVPVVFAVSGNPVGNGIVQSLAHPGGNLTGLDLNSSLLGGKQLDLLKQTVPEITRVAILLAGPSSTNIEASMREREATARGLGIELLRFPVERETDLPGVFAEIVAAGAQGLTAGQNTLISEWRFQIVELALRHRLPYVYASRPSAETGALMSYGASDLALFRRAPVFVDKILKGANPAEIPMEQPTQFDFIINLKTARALGLTIPPSVLLQATETIE